jgi:hypothetical protein
MFGLDVAVTAPPCVTWAHAATPEPHLCPDTTHRAGRSTEG